MIETPLEALQWLKQKSKRVRVGNDDYEDIRNVIALLLEERKTHRKEVEELEKKIFKLENPPKKKHKSAIKAEPQPFGTEGNGILSFQIPPEQNKT